jgi:hypothetical protein
VISPQARSALEAYARGVNAWVSANPLPLEYGLLELSSFKPWDAQDCAAAGALLTFRLSFWLGELDRTTNLLTYVQTGLALGFDGAALYFEDVHRSAPFEPTASLPPAPDVDVPNSCPDVPAEVLDPRGTWADPAAYDRQAGTLAQAFIDNFKTFEGDVSAAVKAAGPAL